MYLQYGRFNPWHKYLQLEWGSNWTLKMPEFGICTSYLFITRVWKFLSLLYRLTLAHPYLVNWFWFPHCSLCTLVGLLTLTSVTEMRSSSAPDLSNLIEWSVTAMTSPTNNSHQRRLLYRSLLFQKLVIENMDVLVQMKNNFDNPEEMASLKKRLTGEKWRGKCGEGNKEVEV